MISNLETEEKYTPKPDLTKEEKEEIIQSLRDDEIWLAPHELPTVPTVKEMFQSLNEGVTFQYVGQTIIHMLTRLTTEELRAELYRFNEAPDYYSNIPPYDYAYIACIVHYHLTRHGLPIPDWVYQYQTNNHAPLYTYQHMPLSSESVYQYPHPILQLYGIDLPLFEIGEHNERVTA